MQVVRMLVPQGALAEQQRAPPGGVNDCAILDVGEGAHTDVVQVTPENASIPYRHLHSSQQGNVSRAGHPGHPLICGRPSPPCIPMPEMDNCVYRLLPLPTQFKHSVISALPQPIQTASLATGELHCVQQREPVRLAAITSAPLTLSNRSTSPTTTALGATQASGSSSGTRLPRQISCRCRQ